MPETPCNQNTINVQGVITHEFQHRFFLIRHRLTPGALLGDIGYPYPSWLLVAFLTLFYLVVVAQWHQVLFV